jgi:putative FmdB family regulatory protein
MPIYEYQCNKCGQINEVLVIGKEGSSACTGCGSDDLTKLMSAHNTGTSSPSFSAPVGGSCCGSPGTCGAPGSCCNN